VADSAARVPTSMPNKEGWSIETGIDHVLALESSHRDGVSRLLDSKLQTVNTLIEGNDRRYEQRFEGQKAAIDAAFAAQKEAINAALAAADRAVAKAEAASEKRFEGVNEFRNTLSDQQRTLIPRSEVDVLVRGLNEKITQLTKQFDAMQAERAGLKGGWGYAVGLVGFVLTLLTLGVLVLKVFRP